MSLNRVYDVYYRGPIVVSNYFQAEYRGFSQVLTVLALSDTDGVRVGSGGLTIMSRVWRKTIGLLTA